MHIRTRSGRVRLLLVAALVAFVSWATLGCQKTPEEQLRTAKGAVIKEKPDIAEENLEAVLAADSENFEARRLMGQVHQLRGNFAKAEESFTGLWDEAGFDDEGAELPTDQKSHKEALEENFTELYLDWADSLDPDEEPEKFEEVARKGLEVAPKKPSLNNMLVDFYESRAKQLVEKGEKLEAADTYEKILDLRTLPKNRSNAEERATNLRFEANKEQMLTYFNDKAKAKFEKADRYDEEEETITFTAEQPISEVEKALKEEQGGNVRLNPRNEKHAAIIQQATLQTKLGPALQKVVAEATGIDEDSDFSGLQPPDGLEVDNWDAKGRTFVLTAKLPVDDLLKLGFQVKEQTRKAEEKAAAEKDGEAEDEGADDAADEKAAKAEKTEDGE
ncbi:MAG: tetratricopeptide repeat protein [Persicimonas sp.]